MSIHYNKSFLMSGKDYPLTSSITLHHPTVAEILSLNEGRESDLAYWKYIQLLMCDPYSNMVMLDDMGKDFMKTSPFDVFILQWQSSIEYYEANKTECDANQFHPLNAVNQALSFFIVEKHDFVLASYDNGNYCLCDKDNSHCQINQEVFEYIYEWLKTINKIDYGNRIKPADENARRVLIEDTRDEIKRAKKKKNKDNDDFDYIGNIMSSVSFGGNGVINPFNIMDCKIYWLFEAMHVENKKSQANHILDGIYHGTISSKDITDKSTLDWTK